MTKPSLIARAFALASCLLFLGCSSSSNAIRLMHDAIAPEYAAYVNADPNLTAEQKARRARTLEVLNKMVAVETGGATASRPTR